MPIEDFWNLAGRAGRWGKEFQGNIMCIDANRSSVWGENGPPRTRAKHEIHRTSDIVLKEPTSLIDYIQSKTPRLIARGRPELEYVFSYLVNEHLHYGSILNTPWADRYLANELEQVATVIREVVDDLGIPAWVIERNPGISPLAMVDLLAYFRNRQKPIEELLPLDPSDENAWSAYTAIFVRLSRFISPKLGPTPRRSAMLALTVTRWMHGFPLSRLITDRDRYHERRGRPQPIANTIRDVMEEVEQIARFEAPRGLSCYCDLLRVHLNEVGRQDLVDLIPNLSVLLELGVSLQMQVSLIGIGLSRTTAIALSELITADQLTEGEVVNWIIENRETWATSDLPALVKREIEAAIVQYPSN